MDKWSIAIEKDSGTDDYRIKYYSILADSIEDVISEIDDNSKYWDDCNNWKITAIVHESLENIWLN